MDILDTGRIRIEPKEGMCLHFSLYAECEVPEEDLSLTRTYIDQFDGKVSFLVTRDSKYSLSAGAQIVMFKDAATRVKAVAYVDRSHVDTLLSANANNTYLRDVNVCCFDSVEKAFEWICQYGPLPKMKSLTPTLD